LFLLKGGEHEEMGAGVKEFTEKAGVFE